MFSIMMVGLAALAVCAWRTIVAVDGKVLLGKEVRANYVKEAKFETEWCKWKGLERC